MCAAVHGVGLGDGQGQGDLVCCSPRGWTGRWSGTRRPGVLQSTGLQRVGQDLVMEQQYICNWNKEEKKVEEITEAIMTKNFQI